MEKDHREQIKNYLESIKKTRGKSILQTEKDEDIISDRNFRILNKLDKCMTLKPNMLFCDLYYSIIPLDQVGKKIKDLEFTLLLDKYIEENSK